MKTIPATLLAAKQLETTTLCLLIKITCRDGSVYGLTTLDRDITFDDLYSSDGPMLYKWIYGFGMSRLQTASGLSVDNADITGITSALEAMGVTEAQLRAGKFDYADLWVYSIDYENLTPGEYEILSRGKFGRVSAGSDQYVGESRSLSQIWKQGITQVTSLTCRAKFGSQPGEERYPCGKVRTWISATITAVDGVEQDRVFTASSLVQASGYFVPAIIRILTGDNAGAEMEVTEFAAGEVSLALNMFDNFQVGDTFQISQDCSKLWDDAAHGCLYHWGTERPLHFRGEPLIPIGREGELSTPGANI